MLNLKIDIKKNGIGSFEIWILYYLLLGIVQALWTNRGAFPPLPLRVVMIAAVFGPVLIKREIILLAFPFSLTILGFLSTKYSYLPYIDYDEFYICIVFIALAIHCKTLSYALLQKVQPLVFMVLLFAIVDIAGNGELGKYTFHIFTGLLLIPFLKREGDFHLLSAAIITASALLSVYYIVMFDQFLEVMDSSGMERSKWVDPNYFSITLNAGFFVAMMYLVGICKSSHTVFNKILLSASCMVIAAAVIMTGSRAGFLCVALTLAIAIFTSRLKIYQILLALLVVIMSGIYIYSKGAMELLLYRFFVEQDIQTGGHRTVIWVRMLGNFKEQGYLSQLFGGGYFHRIELAGVDMHNEFLSIMADYGIIGLLLFIIFVASMASFRRNTFWKQNVAVFFYIISVITLSPFQYIYILFLIVWIYAFKFNNENLLVSESISNNSFMEKVVKALIDNKVIKP